MRRFASVFASKREKKDSSKSRHSELTIALPKPPPLTTPQLTAHSSDRANSSSSSTGSVSLRTPDDDHSIPRSPSKKIWKSWFSTLRSKSGTLNRGQLQLPRSVSQPQNPTSWEQTADWKAKPAPRLSAPPVGHRTATPASPLPSHSEDTDLETENELEDDYGDDEFGSVSSPRSLPLSPMIPVSSFTAARANLRRMTEQGLVSPFEAPPFASVTGNPIFPRSCNSPHLLPTRPSLRITVLKSRLLSYVDAMPDDVIILPLTSRAVPEPRPPSFPIDAHAIPPNMHVLEASRGIRRWIARPCFEDRYSVWLAEDESIVGKAVSGTSFGVLELEYSEAIEAMAVFGLEIDSPIPMTVTPPSEGGHSVKDMVFFDPPVPQTLNSSPVLSAKQGPSDTVTSSPVLGSDTSVSDDTVVPTGLSLPDVNSSIPPIPDAAAISPPSSDDPPAVTESTTEAEAASAKRGVRFAEDTSERIPLGYALRSKQKREEKARFLREEQARRALESERRKLDESRRKLERERLAQNKERVALERQRRVWEQEKGYRDAEQKGHREAEQKERQERKLREEVTNARVRREAQRAGGVPGAASTNDPFGVYNSGHSWSGSFHGSGARHGASSSSSSLREGISSNERNSTRAEKRYSQMSHDSPNIPHARPLLPPHPPVPATMQQHSPRIAARLPGSDSGHPIVASLAPAIAYASGSSNSHSSPSPISNSSPGSSRPSSMSGHGVVLPDGSRPVELLPSSNLAQSDAHDSSSLSASAKKRLSVGSIGSRPSNSRASTMPTFSVPSMFVPVGFSNIPAVPPMPIPWTGSQQNLAQLQMGAPNTMMFPGMPMSPYMMDMPLLPPNAPFMLQQYPKQRSGSRSRTGSSSSRDQSVERGSRRRENSMSGQSIDHSRNRTSSSSSRRPSTSHPKPNHSPTQQYRSHSRRGSTDMSPSAFTQAKRSSSGLSINKLSGSSSYGLGQSATSSASSLLPGSSQNHSSHGHGGQHSPSDRGRAQRVDSSSFSKSSGNAYWQNQSPWTALPTQNGGLPNAMYTGHSQQPLMKPAAARRQTALS
ncbi:hypothetical protein HGRIS_009530 [Hohenbuehelia grisea]|uniref:Uncharacterized protein n=1 Tax=Hohenbuehelia grisea TaxID=104357 RepID=A0ABR3J1G1_9AGAR